MQHTATINAENPTVYRLAGRKGETFRFVQSSLFPDSILYTMQVLSKDFDEFIIEKHDKSGMARIDISCLQSLI